uniref:J domain-containing protein n=1 Tax=Davidia involucrata TaxID=16924 RepID=A0A5B6YRV5_DAVIN
MIGTQTLPARTLPRLLPENRFSLPSATRSDRKMSFAGRNPCKATIHAFTETAPAVTRRPASLYEVLRVKQNATPVEIKTAYRSLAKLYHPDASHSESDGRDFINIHNAYATLSDPAARAVYDMSLGAGSGRRSFGYSTGNRSGFYPTRRWETDQCW